jgi:NADPH:quinone reductase-like Zn-dependent oxidoreductase
MKAVYCTRYGSVENLKIVEIEKPEISEEEILVQVVSSTVQTADWRIRTMSMPGGMTFMGKLVFGFSKLRQPILGTEFSGKITAVGKKVNAFKPGDEIIAATGAKLGAHAEFVKISQHGVVVKKPSSLSFQESASLPFGGLTALGFLKYRAKLKAGEKVLINGASGAVGVAAIQIAKILGAQITAVSSKGNAAICQELGANHVIDYSENNFWQQNQKYDVIFDVVGTLEASQIIKALETNGRLVLISAGIGQMLGAFFRNLFSKQEIIFGVANESKENLEELVRLAETRKYKAVIDKEFSINEIAQAHQHVENKRKRGNVVVNITY